VTGEVFSTAWRWFRPQAGRLVLINAVLAVPIGAADEHAPGHWSTLAVFLSAGVYPVAQGAVVCACQQARQGQRPGLGSYLRIATKIPRLIVAGLISYIGIFVGLALLIVPGFIVIARWSVFVPATVIEDDVGVGVAPLTRSNRLVRGESWTALAVALLPILPEAAITVPNLWLHNLALTVVALIVGSIVATYGAVATLALYEELTHAPAGEDALPPEGGDSASQAPPKQGSPPPSDGEVFPSAAEAARRRLWPS
jgi:hypothetical protein